MESQVKDKRLVWKKLGQDEEVKTRIMNQFLWGQTRRKMIKRKKKNFFGKKVKEEGNKRRQERQLSNNNLFSPTNCMMH